MSSSESSSDDDDCFRPARPTLAAAAAAASASSGSAGVAASRKSNHEKKAKCNKHQRRVIIDDDSSSSGEDGNNDSFVIGGAGYNEDDDNDDDEEDTNSSLKLETHTVASKYAASSSNNNILDGSGGDGGGGTGGEDLALALDQLALSPVGLKHEDNDGGAAGSNTSHAAHDVQSPPYGNATSMDDNDKASTASAVQTPAERRLEKMRRRVGGPLRLKDLDAEASANDDDDGYYNAFSSEEDGSYNDGNNNSDGSDTDDIFQSSYYVTESSSKKSKQKTASNNFAKKTSGGDDAMTRAREPIILADTSSDDEEDDDGSNDSSNELSSSSSSSGISVSSSSHAADDYDDADSVDYLFKDRLKVSSPPTNDANAFNDEETPLPTQSSSSSSSPIFLSPLEPSPDRVTKNDLKPTITNSKAGTASTTQAEPDGSAWVLDPTNNEYYLGKNSPMVEDVDAWPALRIPAKLYHRLYPHQKIGVQWMASMHENKVGGILGDDMGLGKTFQTLTYLGGLMRARTIRNALIICPVSVLRTWEREAADILKRSCVPKITVSVVSSDVKKQRRFYLLQNALDCHKKYPHLVITTYGLVTSSKLDFVSQNSSGGGGQWDYIVADEGHKLKNQNTQVSKACRRICRDTDRTRRLLLTGTPIQNNLKELWALFDWATSGRLLGPLRRFQTSYGEPIEAGRMKNATEWTIMTAEKANKELQAKLRPHFLQRLKSSEFKEMLPTKRELVVFTHLSERQRSMYEKFLASGMVASILTGETASPLEAITWLKKLCGHPYLVDKTGHSSICDMGRKALIRDSSKLFVLHDLLLRLKKSDHRTLVFSQSTKMLDIIQRVMGCKLRLSRIDGSTKEKDRQSFVDAFNLDDSNVDVMLLSTKAAGIGLTLTGADRAVIFDPSWNPADDSQAVDRCFRIGQTKNVTVYRFISAGAVEEAMYKKVVHKDGIKRTVTGTSGCATERHFDKDDLRKIFTLAPAGECEMLSMINGKSPGTFDEDEDDAGGVDTSYVVGASGKRSFLETHQAVVGLASHDQLYTNFVIEVDDEPETPFAGTPLRKQGKMGRAQRTLAGAAGTKLDFGGTIDESDEDDAAVESVPIDLTEASARKPLAKISNKPDDSEATSEPIIDKKQPTATEAAPAAAVQVIVPDPIAADFGKISDDVDEMVICGRTEEAMATMLDVLESGQLKGADKLSMHKKIAALALQLKWL